MFNTYHLSHQLKFNNRKGVPLDFIRKFTIHPNVIVQMIGQPLIDKLETALKLSAEPVMIHYDTVFNRWFLPVHPYLQAYHFQKLSSYTIWFFSSHQVLSRWPRTVHGSSPFLISIFNIQESDYCYRPGIWFFICFSTSTACFLLEPSWTRSSFLSQAKSQLQCYWN